MLKVFTLKFEDKLESFNDAVLSDFLADKEVITWKSQFFERKNNHFWSVVIEYKMEYPSSPVISGKTAAKPDDKYKALLTESDWPLFSRLREWRKEISDQKGVPPYIILTNLQLAKITVTRPSSLNAIQEIDGIGNAKREKYGPAILKIVEMSGRRVNPQKGEMDNG